MEDDKLVEHVARDFLERYGAGEVLRKHAARCEADGDRQTWLEIAETAERLMEDWR